ncbi:hypothetical protein BT96DRAFT_954685 [Gymnopus androsaceus JB14]|uniref:NCS cytosine-purine permease n=1 Tax=Gymnopus androsaceus JB14 TaxID=1447944 RepID=A0A6A4I8C6_9AGAR|nr:hypothetical protein BT96DRAFT_954685 [Gymnopus androsaceus JB14]
MSVLKEDAGVPGRDVEKSADDIDAPSSHSSTYNIFTKRLLSWGVETRGISPVPIEERTDTQFYKLFFIWFTMNFNILSFSAGTLGPVAYGLGIRESCLVILFFNLLCCLPPAYFSTWGPKLGLRQMVQARFSFGYYGVILPCILNLINIVADGNLTWNAGIVIVVIISLFLSFCGYSVLTWYERVAWFPVLVVFLVALGLGGKNLKDVPPSEPADAATIFSFAATIAGFVITYSPLASDFTIYFHPSIFLYTYLGLFIPITSVQCLGAAVAAAASAVPAWEQDTTTPTVGVFPVAGNIAATFYSISLNIQLFIPILIVVPRYVFSIVATAIVLPIAIVGSHKFYDTLENFLGLIGYWCSAFIAVVLIEHWIFRKRQFSEYHLQNWNVPKRLPSGLAGIAAGVTSFGLVVPCMSQIWFTGPVADKTGDIGFEVALLALEIRLRGVL